MTTRGEKVLEAIQQAWIDEAQNKQTSEAAKIGDIHRRRQHAGNP
jgi:hypothetical protein